MRWKIPVMIQMSDCAAPGPSAAFQCHCSQRAELTSEPLSSAKQVVGSWKSETDLERRAQRLRGRLKLEALLLTRGADGMTLYRRSGALRIAAEKRDVYDVTGAGDTVIATLGAMPASAQDAPQVIFMTAGDGSAFLPYGQGVAAYLATKGIAIEIRKSAGSNENLSATDASPMTIGTAFMASAYDAVQGSGWAAGHKHTNIRALFPMYETSFQVAALRKSGIGTLAGLDGKKVGVGPAKGPAEFFFRAAADAA